MSSWRVARAIEQLFVELNAAAPKRSRLSDGTIGDAAHAARTSDHNPWVVDGRGQGVVTAAVRPAITPQVIMMRAIHFRALHFSTISVPGISSRK